LTGARAANLIGHTVKEVMPNTEQYWIDTYGKVAKYGIPISYENYAVEIGKYFDVWAFSPEKDKFAVIFSDTTERKQAEELLRLKNKEFEAQYEEYMQLNEVLRQTNYDLEIAKQRAEESDKLKTAFLQNMSHEIRTPLNGILGFSKLLTDSNLTKEEITEFTSIIHQSGIRLLDLVNNVLDISKIETKQIEVNLSNFSINSLISDLYSFFTPLANTNKLSINYNTTLLDQESIILSDEGKIHQVLSNLISNAIKFTPSGSIDYGYNIENDKITFFVKDTGIGITKHLHEKIFRRFVQAEDTIGRNYEGAGLGLAICKGLVEMMGGTIWIDSEIGNGSTFYFSIPYFSVSLSDYENPAKQSNLMTSTHYKILIAEDDFTSYRVLSRVLENNNFIVLHAENGSQAIDLVNEHPDIALILMDIRMPVMDGMEATKRIKILRADIPIIAQTAYAFSDEKEKILSIGCDDYISKPIEIDKLSKLISKYLK